VLCPPPPVAQTLLFVQNNLVMVAIGGAIVVLVLGSLIYLGCQKAGKRKLTPEQAARASRSSRSSRSSVRHPGQSPSALGARALSFFCALNPGPGPTGKQRVLGVAPAARRDAGRPGRRVAVYVAALTPTNCMLAHRAVSQLLYVCVGAANLLDANSRSATAVRCPICSMLLPSSAALNSHIDQVH
jgi:hypothetical protein